jgi:hypothetical protein
MFTNPNDLSGVVIQELINNAFLNIGKGVAALLKGEEISPEARELLEVFSSRCKQETFSSLMWKPEDMKFNEAAND